MMVSELFTGGWDVNTRKVRADKYYENVIGYSRKCKSVVAVHYKKKYKIGLVSG